MERTTEMKVYKVNMFCDKEDCDGEMLPTGEAYMTYPAQYPHVCNKCGSNNTFNKCYPCTEYR